VVITPDEIERHCGFSDRDKGHVPGVMPRDTRRPFVRSVGMDTPPGEIYWFRFRPA